MVRSITTGILFTVCVCLCVCILGGMRSEVVAACVMGVSLCTLCVCEYQLLSGEVSLSLSRCSEAPWGIMVSRYSCWDTASTDARISSSSQSVRPAQRTIYTHITKHELQLGGANMCSSKYSYKNMVIKNRFVVIVPTSYKYITYYVAFVFWSCFWIYS